MVFSSVPIYLDPLNRQQQQTYDDHQLQQQAGGRTDHNHNPHLPQHPPLPAPPSGGGDSGGGTGSARPGSMADRARLAKIPQPEAALKCPRCDSANTKFCYFNNYSLTQPRHFCKTCRRYWTRGGALRNVPVGGGCRRNKRSKGSSRSKSPAAAATAVADRQTGACSSSSNAIISPGSSFLSHLPPQTPLPHLPFLPNLHHLSADHYGGSGDLGLNFVGIPVPPQAMAAAGGGNSTGGADVELLSTRLVEQWRLQQQVNQFPFLGNLEPPINNTTTGSVLYSRFDHQGGHSDQHDHVEPQSYADRFNKPLDSSAVTTGLDSQMSAVKVEGNIRNNQGLNLSRNFLGVLGNHDHPHYNLVGASGNNAWSDLSSFSTTSSTNPNLL